MRCWRDIIVIGGGAFGLAAALELRRRGSRVRLFDAGAIPREEAASTDVSKMIRMDYGADGLYTELAEQALAGWDAWNREWERPLYHEDGFLLLSRGPLRAPGFEHASHELLTRRGHRLERIGGDRLAARFPAWNAGAYPDGYLNPRAGWAESGEVVACMAARARAAGVEIREHSRLARLAASDERVTGIVTADGRTHPSDGVVLAAGAWTPSLLPHLREAMWVSAQPVLHFAPADPEAFRAPRFAPWGADIANTGWYGFPATADGIVKVARHGAGRRIDPDGPRTVAADEEGRFREFLRGALPSLASAPLVRARLCLYCDTWDGDFWFDHDPDRPGLFVAAGGSGHGFKFAPVLGPIVADRLEGRPNPWAERFRWRRPGPRRTEAARHLGD